MRMRISAVLNDKRLRHIALESWSVSWPMTLIMLVVFLIGFADVYIAGKLGKDIQAAYGLAFQVYLVTLILVMALTVGSVAVISKIFTSGRKKELYESVSSSIAISGVAGFCLAALGIIFSNNIINFFNVPDSVGIRAKALLTIYYTGIFFHYIVMNSNGILRACNMIRKSLLTMSVICLLNVGLNFFLTFRTALGFNGIAVSTVISLIVGCCMNMWFIKRLTARFFNISGKAVKKILDISWPAAVFQIMWHLGITTIYYILSLLPHYNVETIAAFTNGLKIESAIFLPAFAYNMANAVLIGNLLGKMDEKKRALDTGIVTAITGVMMVTLLSLIVLLSRYQIASFLSDNAIVVDECAKYILISLIFEPIMAWGVILGGALNGAGDTKRLMVIVGLSVWLVRIPLCYLLGVYYGLGSAGVWWSMNASIVVQTIFITKRFLGKKWITHEFY